MKTTVFDKKTVALVVVGEGFKPSTSGLLATVGQSKCINVAHIKWLFQRLF